MLQFCVHKITMHKNKRTKKRLPLVHFCRYHEFGKKTILPPCIYCVELDRYRATLISMKFAAVYTYVHSRHKEDKCIINT